MQDSPLGHALKDKTYQQLYRVSFKRRALLFHVHLL